MSFHIRITRQAERDIREIQDWIKERSQVGARNWLSALEFALDRLKQDALSSGIASESEELGVNLRQRFFKTRRGNPYRLIFMIIDDSIEVVAVRGPGQDLLASGDLDSLD